MSLNNPWVLAGVAVALYASWELGRRQGFRRGYANGVETVKVIKPDVKPPYDATALTATISNAGTSGMTIAVNPILSSASTNGAAYNV